VSPLYLNERQRQDQRTQVIERAIERYFDPSRRMQYERRLRHLAEWFTAGGEDHKAELALAAAGQLASAQSVLLNPFARALFERALAPLPGPAPRGPPASSLVLPVR
jgi:hypothetical protein